MANTDTPPITSCQTSQSSTPQPPSKPRVPTKQQQLAMLYSLPAPLRTFPLPSFIPHNPLSFLHLAYVWLAQFISPPSSHYDHLYEGTFSPDSKSVNVTDHRSIRGLWEQGFYGKGSLSRSEPSWLDREEVRRGAKQKLTSEDITMQRRAERQHTKWERARKERETIEQKLLEEASTASAADELVIHASGSAEDTVSSNGRGIYQKLVSSKNASSSDVIVSQIITPLATTDSDSCRSQNQQYEAFTSLHFTPPIGPVELLSLPNSYKDIYKPSVQMKNTNSLNGVDQHELLHVSSQVSTKQDAGDAGYENDHATHSHASRTQHVASGKATVQIVTKIDNKGLAGAENVVPDKHQKSPTVSTATGSQTLKSQKSVRFSTNIERDTFINTEASSHHVTSTTATIEGPSTVNREHFQLTLQEAFFLSYGLGVLNIIDPFSRRVLNNKETLARFRAVSPSPESPEVSEVTNIIDDEFLVNYVVYHHFRSLGWVVRGGVKFAVDYLLYARGPVFTHAEFAVMIMPSYSADHSASNTEARRFGNGRKEKAWSWLHCINRVITQVRKTLILVYVEIPAPLTQEQEDQLGIAGILARYKLREIALKRWSANRSRD